MRITYYDLDFRGKVKLSALLRMVHIAADVNANDLGVGHQMLANANMSFVLQRFGLDITRMPMYDENVIIRTWPAEITRGTFIRRGEMLDIERRPLMEWASLWVLFNINTRKILRPSALPIELPPLGNMGTTVQAQKIERTADFGTPFSSYCHTVRYSEVDTNMHMNNSIYGDLIGNALFATPNNTPSWRSVQINYQGETRLGETIEVVCHHVGTDYLIVGTAPGRTSFTALVETAQA